MYFFAIFISPLFSSQLTQLDLFFSLWFPLTPSISEVYSELIFLLLLSILRRKEELVGSISLELQGLGYTVLPTTRLRKLFSYPLDKKVKKKKKNLYMHVSKPYNLCAVWGKLLLQQSLQHMHHFGILFYYRNSTSIYAF